MFAQLKKDHLNLLRWLAFSALLFWGAAVLHGKMHAPSFAVLGAVIAASVYAGEAFIALLVTTEPGGPYNPSLAIKMVNGLATMSAIAAIFSAVAGAVFFSAVFALGTTVACFFFAQVAWKRYPSGGETFLLAFLGVLPLGIGYALCLSEASHYEQANE